MKFELTVAQLIEHLKTFPQDMPVGITGHFGESHQMKKREFSSVKVCFDQHDKQYPEFEILEISPPYIGDEPD